MNVATGDHGRLRFGRFGSADSVVVRVDRFDVNPELEADLVRWRSVIHSVSLAICRASPSRSVRRAS